MATGLFDEIIVVVPINDKLYLARGPIYNYYEFTSDINLSSKEWQQMNGIIFQDNSKAIIMGEKLDTMPKQLEWKNIYRDTEEIDNNK